jgi:hypothetical protein
MLSAFFVFVLMSSPARGCYLSFLVYEQKEFDKVFGREKLSYLVRLIKKFLELNLRVILSQIEQ